jgi:hypothetical protein
MNEINPLSVLLIFNSVFLIGSIMNQNETKDHGSIQSSSTITSSIEIVTWISLLYQIILLLIEIKCKIV